MKKTIFLILILAIAPAAYATVSTRVCLADGSTLLEEVDPCVYRPIMVGTHLTIIIESNTIDYWNGELTIWDANQDLGVLYGRDYSEETFDWAGSRFPAAGETATVWDWVGNEPPDEQIHEARGFQFTSGDDAIPGDWFILDYSAVSDGNCFVTFNDFITETYALFQLSFTHVRTRDFDDDGIVNFKDFAVFSQNWLNNGCVEPEYCLGTDLEPDGDVDYKDLELFADFWLERTR